MAGKVLNPSQLKAYSVNRAGQEEGITQPLYDYQTYPNAGATSLTFFQIPNGQSGKTLADTNMEQAGTLPAPKKFLIQAIEIAFFPGSSPSVNGAAAASEQWNDTYAVFKSGHFQLFIGSKPYLDEAPLGVFPPGWRLAGAAALSDSTTAGADQQTRIGYAGFSGRPYQITPIMLPTQQNFKVTITWPSAVSLPSGVDGRIGVRLLGALYRLSQ